MTVNEAFNEYLSRIELNPTRIHLASQRYESVGTQIRKSLPKVEIRQVGSFQRKTKIRPSRDTDTFDVDALVCFGDALRYLPPPDGLTPVKALERVRQSLLGNETYKIMEPKPDSPTVLLEYADQFRMELIPCYIEKTGKYPRTVGPPCYIVGSPDGNWKPADYDYDADYISKLNQEPTTNGMLVPSIKMLKAFIRDKQIDMKSFHIELLCADIIPSIIHKLSEQNIKCSYPLILACFLFTAGSKLSAPVGIPGSYSPSIQCEYSFEICNKLSKLFESYGNLAFTLCKKGDATDAVQTWAEMMGSPFPTG